VSLTASTSGAAASRWYVACRCAASSAGASMLALAQNR
jgi:hypothetical protein